MNELEVTIRLRNNRLKRRREELGMTQGQLSAVSGIASSSISQLETMRLSPLGKDGEWRDVALRLAKFHGISITDLFPQSVIRIADPVAVHTMDGSDVEEMLSSHQQRLLESPDDVYDKPELSSVVVRTLATLTPREELVLRMRFGVARKTDHDLEEVGDFFGVTRERIRQIEAKALRKLRHPSRSVRLREFT